MPYPQDLLRLLFRFYKGIQASLIYAQSVENPIKGVASENPIPGHEITPSHRRYFYVAMSNYLLRAAFKLSVDLSPNIVLSHKLSNLSLVG